MPVSRSSPTLRRPKQELMDLLDQQIRQGEELENRRMSGTKQFEQAVEDYNRWDNFNTELLRSSYAGKVAANYLRLLDEMDRDNDGLVIIDGVAGLRDFVRILTNHLRWLRDQLRLHPSEPEAKPQPTVATPTMPAPVSHGPARGQRKRVFIVHGHDQAARETVARYLEQRLELEVVILHEQANQSRTIIEKLEAHSDVDYAIVLLTPDDVAIGKDGGQEGRARQNVVLELGFFCGKLGRSKVFLLYADGVAMPSDYDGVAYTKLDAGGAWQIALARELSHAGIPINAQRLL
ncbi:MAG: TIR domain-containing protein [Thermoplasmatota archaeon]